MHHPQLAAMSHLEKASPELSANPPPAVYSSSPSSAQYYRKLGNPGPLCVPEPCAPAAGTR